MILASLVGVLAVAGGLWAVVARPGSESSGDLDLGGETPAMLNGVVVATGALPDGTEWQLRARRDEQGDICTKIGLGRTANGPPEQCVRAPERVFGRPTRLRWRDEFLLSWMTVVPRVDHVRVSVSDGSTFEVRAAGDEAGLGVRFVVVAWPQRSDLTLTARTATGEELGGISSRDS